MASSPTPSATPSSSSPPPSISMAAAAAAAASPAPSQPSTTSPPPDNQSSAPPPSTPPISPASSPPPSAPPPSSPSPTSTPPPAKSSLPPPISPKSSPPTPASKPPPAPPSKSSPPLKSSPPPSNSTTPGPKRASPPKPPPPESTPSTSPPVTRPPPRSASPPPPHVETPATPHKLPNSTNGTVDSGNSRQENNSGITPAAIAGIGIAVALSLILVSLTVWCVRRKRNKNVNRGFVGPGGYAPYMMPSPLGYSHISEPYPKSSTGSLRKVSSGGHGSSYSPRERGLGNSKWFALEELLEITDGFSADNLLGEGGFGYVYKGVFPDGREVAVKQLKAGGGQGEREFQAEVEIIGHVHHRHLVSLVGYCIAEEQRLLVYEYVPNKTLDYHLHGLGCPVMDWPTRVKVAVGAARGIAYLHEDCQPRIIHRDIKSSNILLDYSFEARVSDFGLAKLTLDADTHVTTRVVGTFGYLAPEYASSGKLTDRSDVYSFGIVLLELITGRKPVDQSQPTGEESLIEWARPLLGRALETGKFEKLPDPRLEGNYSESEMFRIIETAAACVRHSAAMRPKMGLVVRALGNLSDSLDLHNGIKPGQSELFNQGANSEDIRIFNRMAFGEQPFSSDFSQASWISRTQRDI